MIKQFYVSGFKSLYNFTLNLKPGINALIGPNGAGKTSIISFFDFVSQLTQNDLVNAVSSAGGVGTIFRKTGKDYENSIEFYIKGDAETWGKGQIDYKYSAIISLTEKKDTVYYKQQRLQILIKNKPNGIIQNLLGISDDNKNEDSWDFDIEAKINNTFASSIKLHAFNKDRFDLTKNNFFSSKISEMSNEQIESTILEFHEPNSNLMESLSFRFLREIIYPLFGELGSLQYYNIIPSKVRIPEDAASEPYIRKDGSGLYALLHDINSTETSIDLYRLRRKRKTVSRLRTYRIRKLSLRRICEFIKLGNSAIEDIIVENDSFDNQLKVRLKINEGGTSCELPLSLMSDGTLKWVVLVTLILSNESLFAIEEPENYLHPATQNELIQLMRDFNSASQIIISSHSETILNALKPEEVIIVQFKNGRTVAKFADNPELIREEIRRTGFGLGRYYVTGSIE